MKQIMYLKINLPKNKTMKHLKLMLLFISLLFTESVSAQGDTILIQGRFADTAGKEGGRIECTILRENAPLNRQVMFTRVVDAPVREGKFSLVITTAADWFDVTLRFVNKTGETFLLNSGNFTDNTYLLHKGDRPKLWVRPDYGIDFSGNGSLRLSCQEQLYSMGYLPSGALARRNALYNAENYQAAFARQMVFLEKQIEFKRTILDTYRDSLPAQVIRRIWLDCWGQTYGALFSALWIEARTSGSPVIGPAKASLARLFREQWPQDTSRQAVLSAYYTGSLLFKEILTLRYDCRGDSVRSVNFGDIYKSLCRKYHGELRDKLLFIAFLQLSESMAGSLSYVDESLTIMGENESKEMLREWRAHMAEGTPAYPFELPDEKGRRYSLKDFRGKIIIADFWFTGCENCTQVPAAMAAVCRKYAGNKKVAFLSINIDKQQKWWDVGLKDGRYTLSNSLHLSTMGQGWNHPLLRYYNYNSFPELLVIGADGKTVSAYPPNPRADQGKGLIALIDAILKE
jgi:thiol-disulfide isomerase/thioredoxin